MPTSLALQALRKAARILGGEERLCATLDVPPAAYARWKRGADPVPQDVLLMVLDFLSDMETAPNSFILLSGRADEHRGRGQ